MSTQQTIARSTETTRSHRKGHNFQVHLSIVDHGVTIQLPSEGQVVSNGDRPAVSVMLSDHLQQAECLPYPQQEQQQGVAAACQPSRSYERHETTMQESGSAELCQEGLVFQLDNPYLDRMYFNFWIRSSNGDNLDIRAVIHRFNGDPVEKITVIDAVCTHVILRKEKLAETYFRCCVKVLLCVKTSSIQLPKC